ncbi:sugar kinase [Mucilaginibacter sp. RB4R14]|uniref:sugar kinase n=1 Tax=Mucilaginibacter aurantiaciroseus TaxID=2949308 RepID=UPI0020910A23|nr:sugar kinase [Mucilaginibacter aurantiaciroseus]MCO5934180.1 sugar kinase [Mucilaginibacter aurantiaciroseus]
MDIATSNTGAVLTFGELLLRICPDADGDWLKSNQLPVHVGGAELNVATALALWGIETKYFTALPDNGLVSTLINYMANLGINTSAIFKGGNRLGLFYLTKGADMKHDAVIYDRAGSAFAELSPGIIDCNKVLQGVTWFHFSAICPALSQQTADLCEEVLKAASQRNITISIDLNYRARLWQYGKHPQEIMPKLAKYCNLIMGNVWAAESLLGIAVDANIHSIGKKENYLKEAANVSEKIMAQYPKCRAVANTFRFDHQQGIKYYTTLYQDGEFHNSAEYVAEQVTDKVGSGDCFMAGLIYGYCEQMQPQDTLDFATAAAFEKLSIPGDATKSTVAQITKAIKHDR